jgi:ABC-type antimicrobial peptide transport system permease subunit
MSYLAMSAAPIDNEMPQTYNNESAINKKRQSHTKTQKYRQSSSDFNSQKVNSVLQAIHGKPADDDNELGNYNPKGTSVSAKHSENFKPLNPFEFPSKPVSVGGERTKKQEGMTNLDDGLVPQPADNDDLKLQELQSAFMNDAQVRDYYRKLVPNYSQPKSDTNKNYYNSQQNDNLSNTYSNDTNQVLIEKLNYMINLLEEQQDQKTGSVTEEVVLYSFLGVFIIFVVDSFARVGKYVR